MLGMIAGGVGVVSKFLTGIGQRKAAKRIKIPEATYETSPYAKNILSEANRLKNSQAPGTAAATDNIFGNQAAAMGNVSRNATSGSQALSMVGAVQGSTNDAFSELQRKQQEHQLNMLGNWNMANQTMIAEGDKMYSDKVRKQVQAIQQKTALMGAAAQNTGNALNEATTLGFMGDWMRNRNKEGNRTQP